MRQSRPEYADTPTQSDKILVASLPEKEPTQLLTFEERQILKDSEDSLIDVLLILDSTLEIIKSLVSAYARYSHDCSTRSKEADAHDLDMIKKEADAHHLDMIEIALNEQHQEVRLHRRQVETLHKKVQGTMQLVRVTDIWIEN